jgi:hypothetical protein
MIDGRTSATKLTAALLAAAALAGCGKGNDSADTVTVQGDVAIAYAMRATAMSMNPTNAAPTSPGGDLIIREKSSPSAPEHNITAQFTQGAGDVADPAVSYDGKKIVFAMTCPASNAATIGGVPACTGRWNIWEYDMTIGGFTGGTLRRITSPNDSDDIEPAYLPAGRGFVFASNRQTLTKTVQGGTTIYGLDEYERERVFNLHTMDAQGASITQISVNQSHDRNPVVRPDGTIMFSRWEHVGPRNRFAIFRVKPDGTDMFVLYGAHSPGNSFLHPHDMDPNGKYAGFVASDLMALSRTQEGGSLMFIDAANYSEQNTPANSALPPIGGQTEVTAQALNQDRGVSPYGRITAPYPLWDGTDRVLLAYTPCQVTNNGVVVPCASLTADELARLNSNRSLAAAAADPIQNDVPVAYAIYMFDPAKQTWLNVASPPAGFMYTHPVALQARTEPNPVDPTNVDPTLAAQKLGLLSVRSVYDTDGLQRMANDVLVPADLPPGCSVGIVQAAPTDPMDTRPQVADILRIKNPADTAYGCAPARFVRAVRAVAPQEGMTGTRQAIGETDFEPQQILGYAPVEPDGSFKLLVPADTPLALSIIDAKGRNLQTHLNWIQVRPGERRTCDGCHSPRRGAALNSGNVVNTMPAALTPALASAHQAGETMAETRTRLDASLLGLSTDMSYTDVWADTTQSGVKARASITLRYTGNPAPADDLPASVPAPIDGLINYPDQIQPIWSRDRGANTCTNCHTDPSTLDLRATVAGTGRLASYESLTVGAPVVDANGQPVTQLEDGVPVVVRHDARVSNMAGNAGGITRSSRLGEILYGEQLLASADARTMYPDPPATAPDHSKILTAAELRLVTEWMDLGGQYFNFLAASNSPARATALSQATFQSQVLPVLQANCVACHQPAGNSGTAQTPVSFRDDRFVLTGDVRGDFNVTLTMISNTCTPASNYLLSRPSTIPHPAAATGQTTAVLPVGSAGYTAIANWILSGCP